MEEKKNQNAQKQKRDKLIQAISGKSKEKRTKYKELTKEKIESTMNKIRFTSTKSSLISNQEIKKSKFSKENIKQKTRGILYKHETPIYQFIYDKYLRPNVFKSKISNTKIISEKYINMKNKLRKLPMENYENAEQKKDLLMSHCYLKKKLFLHKLIIFSNFWIGQIFLVIGVKYLIKSKMTRTFGFILFAPILFSTGYPLVVQNFILNKYEKKFKRKHKIEYLNYTRQNKNSIENKNSGI